MVKELYNTYLLLIDNIYLLNHHIKIQDLRGGDEILNKYIYIEIKFTTSLNKT